MKFGKFIESRVSSGTLSDLPPAIPYKRLKKVIKRGGANPKVFLATLEAVCDEVERSWQQRALACLKANSKRKRLTWGSCTSENIAQDLGNWAALNALALRKILKKFDKAVRGRQEGAWADTPSSAGADWMQKVALARLSFLRSALRLEVFALAKLIKVEGRAAALGAGGAAAVEPAEPEPPFPEDEEESEPRGASACSASDSGAGDRGGCRAASRRKGSFDVFDYELKDAADVSDLTSCQLCFEVMVAPVAFSSCGHPVCRPCFDRMSESAESGGGARQQQDADGQQATCPMCRSTSRNVELVQLKRLAKLSHPGEYAARQAELRGEQQAARRASVHAAVRSLFMNHIDVLALQAQEASGGGAQRAARPDPPHHLARLLPGDGAKLAHNLKCAAAPASHAVATAPFSALCALEAAEVRSY